MAVYLDNQATTPMPESIIEIYSSALKELGNPSSIHQSGQRQRGLLEDAKGQLSSLLGCEPAEIIFTSGGTESINTVLKGAIWAAKSISGSDASNSIASTRAEHHATLDALNWLTRHEKTNISWIEVDSDAVLEVDGLADALESRRQTIFTTLLANNEVGSIQPVAQAVQLCKHYDVLCHIDAVAALGYIPINFAELGATAMSVSAHKVGGPVGVGAVILGRDAPRFSSLVHGGDQQRMRSGTLDVAGVVAFAAALELRENLRKKQEKSLSRLRDDLMRGLLEEVPELVVRGSLSARLPGNLHFTVPACEGDVLLYLLDQHGIQVSTGSACQAGVSQPSHVVMTMGSPEREARGSLRFSLSYHNSTDEIKKVIAVFGDVVEQARAVGYASKR